MSDQIPLDRIREVAPHGVYLHQDDPKAALVYKPARDEKAAEILREVVYKNYPGGYLTPEQIVKRLQVEPRKCDCEDGWRVVARMSNTVATQTEERMCPSCHGSGLIDEHAELRAFVEGLTT